MTSGCPRTGSLRPPQKPEGITRAPPDGPKALDRAMERAARRDAQTAAAKTNSQTAKRQPKPNEGTRPSDDEKAAF